MAGARGLSWRRHEVIDLLEIWGQNNVQKALRESHRNREVFEEVARKMAALGHQRSGDECRSKTKAMRQAYKKVLCHNNKSGNSPTTCAFFEELDNILKGDPSVKRRRTSQSLCREKRKPLQQEEELVTLNMVAVPNEEIGAVPEKIRERDRTQEELNDILDAEDTEEDVMEEQELTQTETSFSEIPDPAPRDENAVASTSTGCVYSNIRNPKDIPPGIPLSDLSPPSRLALREEKRRKVSAMQKVGELMLRQSSREHRILMESSAREHHQLITALHSAKEDDKNTNKEMCMIFRETLLAIKEMSQGSQEKTVGHSCCHYGNNRSPEQNKVVEECRPVCHSIIRRSAKKLFQACSSEPGSFDVDGLEPLIDEAETFLENIDYVVGTPENRPRQNSSHKGYCAAGGMHDTTSSKAMCDEAPQDISYNHRFNPAEKYAHTDMQGNESENEDSPDMVGTHVWGETPLDNQCLREQFKPFYYNPPKTITGEKTVTEKPSEVEKSSTFLAATVVSEIKKKSVGKVSKSSVDSSQSLLRNMTQSLVADYDSAESEDYSNSSTPRVIRYNLRYISSESGHHTSYQQSSPQKLKVRKNKTSLVQQEKPKNLQKIRSSPYRGKEVGPRSAEATAGPSSPGSEDLGRAKRICRPKVIFSPE